MIPQISYPIRRCLVYYVYYNNEGNVARDPEITKSECQSVTQALERIGFDVRIYVNEPKNELEQIFKNVQKLDMTEYEAFVLIFVTTMRTKGLLKVNSGRVMNTEDIVKMFMGDSCVNLVGKPKILLFQACEEEVSYDETDFVQSDSLNPKYLPISADMLVINSSYRGGEETNDSPNFYLELLCKMLDSEKRIILPELFVNLNFYVKRDRTKNKNKGNPYNRSKMNQCIPEIMSTMRGNIILRPDAAESLEIEDFMKVHIPLDDQNAFPGTIFNFQKYDKQINREGSEKDVDRMKEAFEKCQISFEVESELNKEDFETKLEHAIKQAGSPNLSFTTLMAHGLENKMILKDEQEIALEKLNEHFSSSKTNIVLCQMCRGKDTPYAAWNPNSEVEKDGIQEDDGDQIQPDTVVGSFEIKNDKCFPITQANVLIFWSTFFEEESMRESNRGSWFIQQLCNVIDDLQVGEKYNFLDICVETCCRVSGNLAKKYFRQMPVINMTLTKHIFIKKVATEIDVA